MPSALSTTSNTAKTWLSQLARTQRFRYHRPVPAKPARQAHSGVPQLNEASYSLAYESGTLAKVDWERCT